MIVDEPLTVEGAYLTASLKIRRKRIYEAFREQFESLYDDATLLTAATVGFPPTFALAAARKGGIA